VSPFSTFIVDKCNLSLSASSFLSHTYNNNQNDDVYNSNNNNSSSSSSSKRKTVSHKAWYYEVELLTGK